MFPSLSVGFGRHSRAEMERLGVASILEYIHSLDDRYDHDVDELMV